MKFHLSWEEDETPDKPDFRKEYPHLKHPDKRISGWRKSVPAQEEKRTDSSGTSGTLQNKGNKGKTPFFRTIFMPLSKCQKTSLSSSSES